MGELFLKDQVVGFDFAGAIKDIGIRGESAYNFSDLEDNFIRAVLGADYTFPNTFSIVIEYYYNGEGETDEKDYDFQRQFFGEIFVSLDLRTKWRTRNNSIRSEGLFLTLN